ncbi:DUF1707 domain-containing protein [Nocardiopsis sp. HUAS JQ3]|uniref:DUF1707 SHOCT-like domain-containing protein n=1 Tax=Nocardiopsis sp. HUAS JQ3 TaxID=3061629 RepID=UPI0023A9B5A0|nr:DUF1707 domain-containing protein [Nocardiopsis sp. HUAS JQ3]WDZ93830.1 DUF1707 domain-containing protein [Nocardiopsis sp. HUAS JQ3]
MRVSDAERDQVAEVLREAAAQGRITLDELDERLNAVYAAKTYADLEPVTADLPTGAETLPGTVARPVEGLLPERRDGGDALVIRSQSSTVVRKGVWKVPHRVEVYNKYGSTRLDFREASLATSVVEVHVDASWGSGDVILPEGATADVEADASWFGTLRNSVDSLRRASAPHFVITGSCQGGSLTIRYKRPFSWGALAGLGS